MRARVSALLIAIAITASPVAAQQHGPPGAGISRGGGAGFIPGASVPTVHAAPVIRSTAPPITLSAPPPTVRSLAAPAIGAGPERLGPLGPGIHVVHPGAVLPLVTPQSPGDATARETVRREPDIANRPPVVAGPIDHKLVTRSVYGLGAASVLHNDAFATLSKRDPATRALASATFQGRLVGHRWHDRDDGWFWRHRRPIIVIGWFGPLFWPYAYGDLFDYTFAPYAYDAFWPYAFDDLYVGLFGPYGYEGAAYPAGAPSGGPGMALRYVPTGPEVCGAQVAALTDWPIEQIAQTVQPTEAQQAALDDLRDATGKALGMLQSACPTDLPSTPTGRLAAMRTRIEAMVSALGIVRPALERFFGLLNDEQKARFNLMTPQAQAARQARSDVARMCANEAVNPIELPAARIERMLRLDEGQLNALGALKDASLKAADFLKANCPAAETLTPPGRAAAMEQRLNTVLDAIKIVQPALENFYGKLSDEQKARFNQLAAGQS